MRLWDAVGRVQKRDLRAVIERVDREPEFVRAMLEEEATLFVCADPETGAPFCAISAETRGKVVTSEWRPQYWVERERVSVFGGVLSVLFGELRHCLIRGSAINRATQRLFKQSREPASSP